jgi:hypothetical protein
MSTPLSALLALVLLAVVAGGTPPASTIVKFEDLGGKPYSVTTFEHSITLNGQPSLFLSGSLHYPRSTPQMWDGLMSEAKANGLTMIEVYVFWNLHERVRGEFDFATGRRDLPLFLTKAAHHGLFVYLRPGPYVCAEWDYGGLPVWLHGIEGMSFRTSAPAWKVEAERWLKKVVSVIDPFLARNGGPVMLMQIENELWPGDYMPATGGAPAGSEWPYTQWCAEVAISLDVGVPWTMCNGASADSTINTFNGNNAVSSWFFRQDGFGHQFPNGSHARYGVRNRNPHARMPLVPTPARLKLLHTCDQCHLSRMFSPITD